MRSRIQAFLCLFCFLGAATAFHTFLPKPFPRARPLSARRKGEGSKKGFGSPPPSPSPSKQQGDTSFGSSGSAGGSADLEKRDIDAESRASPADDRIQTTGALRLAEMEARRAAEKKEALDKVVSLTEEDDVARDGGGVIPTEVANRMTSRMWGFVGLPFGETK